MLMTNDTTKVKWPVARGHNQKNKPEIEYSSSLCLQLFLHHSFFSHLPFREKVGNINRWEKGHLKKSLHVCTHWSFSDYSPQERAKLSVGKNPFSYLCFYEGLLRKQYFWPLSLHFFLTLPQRRGTDFAHQWKDKCLGSTEPHPCTAMIFNL